MSFAKLKNYPFVCWICLRPEDARGMTPLDTEEQCFEGTIRNYLAAALNCTVDEHKRHLFPRSICAFCRKSLESFARFRTKVRNVHGLMNGLVELRHANAEPIEQWIRTNPTVLAEFKVTGKANARVEDLIAEFPQFEIASLPASTINSFYVEKIKTEPDVVGEEGDIVLAVEFLPELVELKEEFSLFEGLDYEASLEDNNDAIFEADSHQDFSDEMQLEVETATKPVPVKRKRRKEKNEEIKQKKSKLDSPLRCSECLYETRIAYQMRRHEDARHGRRTKVYHCKEANCTESFDTRSRLDSHVDRRHRSHVCEQCGQTFSFRSTFSAHKMRAHGDGESKYSCEYCKASFKLVANLRVHIRNVHRPLKSAHKCDICEKEFRFNHLLELHKRWHSDAYDFPCPQCDKKFKNKHALGKHTTKVHRERLFGCDHCERMFGTKGSLLDHIEHVHEIQMRFVCDICVAVFESTETLATHKARHQNPKLLECGQCLVVLPAEDQFRHHLCIQYRDDYVCCGRDLVSHQQYNRHQLIGHGVKTNVRVKPIPGVLLGRLRATRKRVETCPNCKATFSSRKLRDEHRKDCEGGDYNGN